MIKILLSILCLVPSLTFASENIANFDDKNISVLNDELRLLNTNVNGAQASVSTIRGYFTNGILETSHGGTGSALADPNADKLLFWDDSSGYFEFLSIGSGLSISGTTITAGPGDYVAGDYLIAGPSRFANISSTSYTKIAEIYIPRAGTLRVKFSVGNNDGGITMYGRIYRNGSAVGTERSVLGTTSIDLSEDISGWVAGDLLQLYAKVSSSSGNQQAGGLKIYENAPYSEIFGSGGIGKGSGSLTYKGDIAPSTCFNSLGSIGDLYMYENGGASTTLYVKTGTSTWTAK